MTIRFVRSAEAELRKIAAYYEQHGGLGTDFLIEIRSAIDRIEELPGAWQRLDPDVRRYCLSRFPYGVVYIVLPDEIAILAVMHLHRAPDYWKRRLKEV